MAATNRKNLHTRLRYLHGNDCCICGLPVILHNLYGKKLRPTVEHIKPRAHFPIDGRVNPNHLSNLRIAHASCNSMRADKELTPELRDYITDTAGKLFADYKHRKKRGW